MILGGFHPGSYFPAGSVSAPATPPPPAAQASQPGGAWLSHTAGRYKGSKQRFEDGKFVDHDAMLEEVGAPQRPVVPSPNAPPFEPPKPWTPDTDRDEDEEDLRGREAISLPSLPEVPKEPPLGKKAKAKKQDNHAAIVVLLAAIMEWA